MRRYRLPFAFIVPVCFAFVVSAAPVPDAKEEKQKELEKWYIHFLYHPSTAQDALVRLAAMPAKDVVPFLAKKLRPLSLTDRQARQILEELGSEKKEVVRRAFETMLQYLDVRLAMTPHEAFKDTPQEVRRRLAAAWLGEPMEHPDGQEGWKEAHAGKKIDIEKRGTRKPDGSIEINERLIIEENGRRPSYPLSIKVSEIRSREWERATRCVVLLEHIGTPDAVELLKVMATGHPDAKPTRVAKAVIERLAAKNLPEPNLEAAYDDLMAIDEAVAGRAILLLYRNAKAAVPLLKAKCVPLKLSEERCKELLKQLGSDDEKTWKAAVKELEYFDPKLAFELPKLFELVPDGTARARMSALLGYPRGVDGKVPFELEVEPPVELKREADGSYCLYTKRFIGYVEHHLARLQTRESERLCVAAQLLRQVGTPDAVKVLEQMATGHPEAPPTAWAKVILEALKKK